MLNPSIDQMLAGMADALARTVLPELAPGPARDELQAAIALTRRLARAGPGLGSYLHADTVDLRDTLLELWAAIGLDEPTGGPVADALAHARVLPAEPPPDLTALTATNLTLRQAVADLALDLTGSTADAPVDDALRALVLRLARREADQLRLSPWTPLH